MTTIEEHLESIEHIDNRQKIKDLFNWILEKYPSLVLEIKWNQPMFLDHGTFIIGFSFAKNHFSVAIEEMPLNLFSDKIIEAGYTHSKKLFKILWQDEINKTLLAEMIDYNIQTKASVESFWR